METRTARLSVGHSGGTAGAGSRNYKVTLPTKWIERLGLGVNNREMELALDGDRIIITPRLTAEEFAENAINHAAQSVAVKKAELIHTVSVLYGILCELPG